jgi:Raf kinase inhibitor-like YbhB/YbcL family protein
MTNDPYARVPQAPSFRVTSEDVRDGEPMPKRNASQGAGGENVSPQLSWYGFPPETRSFVVTMYDADAPTPSGFWHWVIADIPGDVRDLPAGAGKAGDGELPGAAHHVRNDAGATSYLGPAPPQGHGPHHYYVAVHALDVDTLGIASDTSPASLSFLLLGHTLARAVMVPWFEAGEAAATAAA